LTPEQSLIIVEDDASFARTLKRSFERRGYSVVIAASIEEVRKELEDKSFGHAVVDLKLGGASGLACVELLHNHDPEMLIAVLTGFASIATAVEAIKLGADDYLAKPVTAGVVADLLQRGRLAAAASQIAPVEPMSPRRLEWEHIHRVLAEHAGNISATARTLKMHRRTLQRKLAKRPIQN